MKVRIFSWAQTKETPNGVSFVFVFRRGRFEPKGDLHDNCVSLRNPDQVDVNANGRGDICDDFDQDSVMNFFDNCPNDPNRSQVDSDGDKKGDVCDKEESRVTEKYPWIPWVGIISALLVLIWLFILTAKKP